MMVNEAMKPFAAHRLHPWQKTLPIASQEAGTHLVVREMAETVDRGARWVQELDIRDCFPSFDRSLLIRPSTPTPNPRTGERGGQPEVRGLPLPRKVIETVVLAEQTTPYMSVRPTPRTTRPYGTHLGPIGVVMDARRGIAQGSHCSSLVAELVIADMLRDMPDGRSVRTFADNVFIACAKKAEVLAISQALSRLFHARSAGRIILSPKRNPKRVADGCVILGYRVVRRMSQTIIGPSRENIRKLREQLHNSLAPAQVGIPVAIAQILRMIGHWARSFPLWGADTIALIPYGWCSSWARKHLRHPNSENIARALFHGRIRRQASIQQA